jgi:hypothetical protein
MGSVPDGCGRDELVDELFDPRLLPYGVDEPVPMADHRGMPIPIWEDDKCPACGGDLRLTGFLLCLRAEDQRRACRTPLWCAGCDRVWTRWADRPGDALVLDDVPLPISRKRSLRATM